MDEPVVTQPIGLTPSTGGRGRPAAWVVIGIVVVVAAGALALLAFGDSDDGPELTDEGPSAFGPDQLWGNRYQVVSTTERTGAEPWTPPSDPALTITFGTDESVSFTGCNGGRGSGSVDGDQLTVTETISTSMACLDPDGEALMAHDTWMASFLGAGVTVAGTADEPVLSGTDGGELQLRLIGPAPEPPPPVDDPDSSVSSDDESNETTQAP